VRGFLRIGCMLLLADDLVILSMRTDPEPLDAPWNVMREGTISLTDTNGPQFTDAFEV
jgi:hypothetical protein